MASILKVDEMQGVTSAGDITITSEGGSATMQLQQGVVKNWVDAHSDATLNDSFNTASGTDNGTGDYTYAFTNNMSGTDYAQVSTASWAGLTGFDNGEQTASSYNIRGFARTDSLTVQDLFITAIVTGDLA